MGFVRLNDLRVYLLLLSDVRGDYGGKKGVALTPSVKKKVSLLAVFSLDGKCVVKVSHRRHSCRRTRDQGN